MASSLRRLCVRCVGHLHRDLRGKVILVGDAAGLHQAVGPIFFGARMRTIRLGHVEIGLRAIPREPEVGVIKDGDQLTAADPIALCLEHALEARGNLRARR